MQFIRSPIFALWLLAYAILPAVGDLPELGMAVQPPRVEGENWCRNPIDQFVEAQHRAKGISPSPEASRETLIRRLSFDLIGLPPTPDEVDAFVFDRYPDAYQRLVARLLASPHFGERMAIFWLDLARYADSDGYHDDTNRSMWPYRDYVIKSFNDNKPFDQFTIEQLAGDLLPEPKLEQLVATAFHRNAPTSSEDGADPEEYRARYAVDRVNTTAQVWLGLTVKCAECHDHKYDPISTREYYQLFAFFNQTPEVPLFRGADAPPTIRVPNEEQSQQLANFADSIAALRQQYERAGERVSEAAAKWQRNLHASGVERAAEGVVLNLPFEGADDTWLAIAGTRRGAAQPRVASDGKSVPKRVPGLIGNAAHFCGAGDAIDLGQMVEFRRSMPFTVEAWVLPEDGGSLISKIDAANKSRGIDVRIVDGRLSVRLIDSWPDNVIEVATASVLSRNHWQHISVTWDGRVSPEGLHLHVNGEPQDLISNAHGVVATLRNRSPLILGGNENADSSFSGAIDEFRFYKWPLSTFELQSLPLADATRLSVDWQKRYYLNYVNAETVDIRRRIERLQTEEAMLLSQVQRLRIMRDTPQPRPTHVLVRGDFRALGELVQPGTPSMLAPLGVAATRGPRYASDGSFERHDLADAVEPPSRLTRLDLANWLVRQNGPHTAKVIVNRMWAQFFGRGIVATLDDFGNRGDPASHPELLDWLANEMLRSRWDLKALIREIVTSSTYRQSSSATREQWRRDPENRLLARGPRSRLPAELIRDNALSVSGLLVDMIGGPSVRPYQPAGLWREMAKGDSEEKAYQQSHGGDLYRRGVYTFWKRSIHYPAFALLDAPSREVCSSSRPVTNTPVQALALLNDPTYVETARCFAAKVMRQADDFEGRFRAAFRAATSRLPGQVEIMHGKKLYETVRGELNLHSESIEDLLSIGEAPIDGQLNRTELAIWTAMAQVILTMDETLSKE